jgi:hypothetical protein
MPSVNLSAQNLGEEGTAYVIEALAFNPGCTAVDLSKNGIGTMGVSALAQVLPTSVVRTLVLSTNSVSDQGAEALAQALSGERESVKEREEGYTDIPPLRSSAAFHRPAFPPTPNLSTSPNQLTP